jgi:hypothetical protein
MAVAAVRRLVSGVVSAAMIAAIMTTVFVRVSAQKPEAARGRGGIQRVDPGAFQARLRAAGHRKIGGIAKDKTDRGDARFRSLPHFTSSFRYNGTVFPYTMVGNPPKSGKSVRLRSVIVPLRMEFAFFADDPIVFDPAFAVQNILESPLYRDATFVNGVGQFGDMLQRTTFWNRMDPGRDWHVRMAKPRVTEPVTILVEPDIGEVFDVSSDPAHPQLLGNVRFGAMDSQIHTMLQFMDIQPDEVPIFVSYNVFADALGYHDAFSVPTGGGTETLQTLIYTSWLEPAFVGDLLADVSTFNHELAEWLNDPFVNNVVPLWEYPPLNVTCGDNPFLEVGDPQGNGPQFDSFPTVPIPLNGYTYHLQDLVMLPWFAHESPSSAQNGWYAYPDPNQITTPAVKCP